MDCRSYRENINHFISYAIQNEQLNPDYFPLFFDGYVVLPNGDCKPDNWKRYEIHTREGYLIWCWENDGRPLPKVYDVIRKLKLDEK